jgi:hypothetical protein
MVASVRRPARGNGVLRLRRRFRPLLLGAVALIGAMLAVLGQASAQSAADYDALLMRPALDGNPQNPPRFRRVGKREPEDSQPVGVIPDYHYQPAFGAGTTGFDSTNSRKKRQRAPKGQAKAPSKTAASTISNAAASNVAAPNPTATIQDGAGTAASLKGTTQSPPSAPAPTPAVAAASGASRYRKLQARGSVPLSDTSDAAVASVDTTSARHRLLHEQNPFDPTGIQVGAFLLRPAIEVSGGYDTNPDRTSKARPSWFYVVAPELRVNSNWAVHELTAVLRGSYTGYQSASDLNRPNLDARVDGRIDVREGTRVDLEGRLLVGTDNPGSPNIQAGLAKLPIFITAGATAGIGQRFNRFEITSKGLVDRIVYQSSTFTDGSVESNDDRNYNQYTNQTRLSYEFTPGVKPFVEGGADERVHDLAIDKTGVNRDSTGYYVKGGTSFELSRIFIGEGAVGWLARRYQDPTLPNIGGLTIDASLTWLASALTTVKLGARTSVSETILPGVSGAFTRESTIEINHAFRRWLIATLKLTAGSDDYVGSPRLDRRYAASAGIIYKLTREMQLKAEYRHERLRSNFAGNDYDADIFLLGARLQR